MSDPIIQHIESFRSRRGQLAGERRNRGYTLYRSSSGATVARLRPTGQNDRNRCDDPTYEFRARAEMMCAVPG